MLLQSTARIVSAIFLAATFGAATSGAANSVPAALANALVRDPDVASCAQTAHAVSNTAYVGANFQLSTVRLRKGPQMAILTGGDSCVCGNANCKVAVYERDGDAYRPVLSDYAIDSDVRPDGIAVITSHDSAGVSDRTTYRWNGKTYAITQREMVYLEKNVAKPLNHVVAFAPGTSSAILHGTRLALGFEDHFTFNAKAGQRATLTLHKHDAHFGSFAIQNDGVAIATAQRGSLAVTLPATGTYGVMVEGNDETLSSYELKLTIR